MVIQIRQTAANSIFEIDYEKALKIRQQPCTLKILGRELPEKLSLAKTDFEQGTKKVRVFLNHDDL